MTKEKLYKSVCIYEEIFFSDNSKVLRGCLGGCVVLQREYEEFKVRINALVAKAQKKPEEGWVMQDGTPWPGNNTRDHPGMIQVQDLTFLIIFFSFLSFNICKKH